MNRAKLIILGALFICSCAIWYFYLAHIEQKLIVAFLDIGQGDAIFIQTPSGNQVLIDGGPNAVILERLAEYMPIYDHTLDVVIATHADSDHIGGLPDVFERYAVASIIDPGKAGTTGMYAEYAKRGRKETATYIEGRRGQVLDLGDGVFLVLLYPDHDVDNEDPNDGSIVARLVYGDISFLLTGDAPLWVERLLVRYDGANLQSTVLKAGHHGSNTSTGEEFVRVVAPEYAVISAGENNRYGHPHSSVLEILKQASTTILSTAEQGSIIFESDGEKVWVK